MSGSPVSTAVNDLPITESFNCEIATTCQPPSAWCKDPWPATIREITTSGLRLTLNRRFERGSGLAIELPTEEGMTTVLARISQTQAMGPGLWLLQCTFISELSEEEVRRILDLEPVQQATLSEHNIVLPGEIPTIKDVLFQAKFPQGGILRWYVNNLKSSHWPLQRGKILSLQVGGVGADHTLDLNIRACRKFGSFWIVDCKIKSEPDSVILQKLITPDQKM